MKPKKGGMAMEKGYVYPWEWPLSARKAVEELEAEVARLQARIDELDPPKPEVPDEIYFDVDRDDGWDEEDAPEWINTKDKFPPFYEFVLATDGRHQYVLELDPFAAPGIGFWLDENKNIVGEDYDIVAWKPI